MDTLIWVLIGFCIVLGWELDEIRKSLKAIQHMMFTEWTERRRARSD